MSPSQQQDVAEAAGHLLLSNTLIVPSAPPVAFPAAASGRPSERPQFTVKAPPAATGRTSMHRPRNSPWRP